MRCNRFSTGLTLGAVAMAIVALTASAHAATLVPINSVTGSYGGNYAGTLAKMIDGSGMTLTDPADPSTWTATSNAYGNEWQTRSLLSGATNSKIAWTALDLGSSTANLENLYLWNVREDPLRGTNTYNMYYSDSPTVALPPAPATNTAGSDYDFASGGWTLFNTSGALSVPQRGNSPDPPNAVVNLGGISAQYIGLEILTNHGTTRPNVGLAEVAITAGAAGGGGELAGELGVLDPANANGGVNPATGAAWQEGDQYRLAFHTSTKRDATSTDINDYNTFVNTVADGSVAFPSLGDGDKWKVLGSTATVSARQNTGTETNDGLPIFVLDGTTLIAKDSDDMWNGFSDINGNAIRINTGDINTSPHYSPYLNEEGTGDTGAVHGVNVATGTNPGGTIRTPLGGATVNWGSSNANRTGRVWVRWDSGDPTSQWSFYALSDPLALVEDSGGPGPGPGPGPVEIPIFNGSFELPPRGDGGYGPADGWAPWGPDPDVGNWNPEGYQFSAGAPDGDHVGWAYQYAPLNGTPNGLTQVLTTNFEAGTEYELTVEVGNAYDYYFPGYAVQLLAGGTVIAEDNNTLHPAWEEWATSTVGYSYDPVHAALVGQPLEIRLLALGLDPEGGGTDVEVEFDNVRLTALSSAAVPEPGTFALAALGLLGLAWYARRRRRS